MKINLENMKGLAEKLDYLKPPPFEEIGVTDEDVCNMAYQLQYFFEALEKIRDETKHTDGFDSGYGVGLECALDILNNALIDKGEIR